MVNYVALTWALGVITVTSFAIYALVYGWWW
jgi:hypothetical protein